MLEIFFLAVRHGRDLLRRVKFFCFSKTIHYKHAIALTQVIDLAKRKLEAWEPPDHLKNIIEFAKAVVTSARWVLMKIRKLGGAHPAELKLTKCLGKYFKSKIISLKRKLIEYPDKKSKIN